MRIGRWLEIAIVLINEVHLASSIAFHRPSLNLRGGGDNEISTWQQTTNDPQHDHVLERRSVVPATSTTTPTTSTATTTSTPTTATSIQQSCVSAVSNLNVTAISNSAGYAACYNLLSFTNSSSTSPATFQADLRLFQVSNATDIFASYPANSLSVLLHFPTTTTISVLNSSTSVELNHATPVTTNASSSSSGSIQIEQYSFTATLDKHLSLSHLTTIELLSLVIPQITISAPTNSTSVSTSTSSTQLDPLTDACFFTSPLPLSLSPSTSPLQPLSLSASDISQILSPATSSAAIQAATPFTYPGRTFGIFPTGLIVTGSWTVLFVTIYLMGTYERYRAREGWRKRVRALGPRRLMLQQQQQQQQQNEQGYELRGREGQDGQGKQGNVSIRALAT